MTITPSSNPIHTGPVVGSVPSEGATRLVASDPASAITGTATRKRPIAIASASVRL
jgi:hypothetical protein